MKRFILSIMLGALILGGSVVASAETATQNDQNSGFVDFATTSITLGVGSSAYILGEVPANIASWTANHPNSAYVVLPESCKGFVMNATGSNVIIGHPNDVSSGTPNVGYPVTAGTPFQWASRAPERKVLQFRVINNGAATAYLGFAGWGD